MGDAVLPHEAEVLRSACLRCAEAFEVSRKRADDVRKGIQDTQPFVDAKYGDLGLFVPREEEVRQKMTQKLLCRLEVLAKGLRETVSYMESQAALFAGKYEELTRLSERHWQALSILPGLKKTLDQLKAENESNQRFLASLRYFR